jgi:drug/metabolite transporter (DMT)-like permease
LTPVFSVISAAIFLKEDFTAMQFLGAVIIFVGLYISVYLDMAKK